MNIIINNIIYYRCIIRNITLDCINEKISIDLYTKRLNEILVEMDLAITILNK